MIMGGVLAVWLLAVRGHMAAYRSSYLGSSSFVCISSNININRNFHSCHNYTLWTLCTRMGMVRKVGMSGISHTITKITIGNF